MFDKDYSVRGKHATYWKELCKTQADDENTHFKIFERYVDAYMVAPLLGLLYGRKGHIDPSDKDKENAGMLTEVLSKNQAKLKYIYRLIMLIDSKDTMSHEERINRAFRYDSDNQVTQENMKIFNAYFLGGLEYLYETFVEKCIDTDGYLEAIYNFVEEFKQERDIDTVSIEISDILAN
jgi:hypothetical protein